jgi:hypothetical protein
LAVTNALSFLAGYLHVDPVGVLDVQAGEIAVRYRRAALLELARHRLLVETGYPDREVIDLSGLSWLKETSTRPLPTRTMPCGLSSLITVKPNIFW